MVRECVEAPQEQLLEDLITFLCNSRQDEKDHLPGEDLKNDFNARETEQGREGATATSCAKGLPKKDDLRYSKNV